MSQQPPLSVIIRPGSECDDAYVTECWGKFWKEISNRDDCLLGDWDPRTRTFTDQARKEAGFCSFVAETTTGSLVGCACCQLFRGLYPLVMLPELRQFGYIWGVFVEADYRVNGLGKQLVEACIEHLRKLGCTRVILHAAPLAEPLYKRLGFVPNNEMKLDLVPTTHVAGGAMRAAAVAEDISNS